MGTLPTGQGGRPATTKKLTEWKVHNACRDVSALEAKLKANITKWNPDFDWVPRPLMQDQKFFLVFFSGHRQYGDIASWMHWDGRVTPISIDLAVDPVVVTCWTMGCGGDWRPWRSAL